jgi:hypothetical protein
MWSAAFKVVAELCLHRIEGCSSSVALIKARSLQQRKNYDYLGALSPGGRK